MAESERSALNFQNGETQLNVATRISRFSAGLCVVPSGSAYRGDGMGAGW